MVSERTLETSGVGHDTSDGRSAAVAPRSDSSIPRGTLIGRYVVLSKVGAGGMGVVLAAYDPELDRKVALKLLEARGEDQTLARTRLRREAMALAKLDHPNVVGVHDVGVHDDVLFVGMEFVEGQTLGAWMSAVEQPRPWREILRVFMAAGRGLAAAHSAGLVHRDFKPDNVMLGDDGRVRVMDFGLARAEGVDISGAVDLSSGLEPDDDGPLLASSLTQTGVVVGTPAYMSLEQFEGQPADARSDQFCFCVALYEALYGERPFASDTLVQLLRALKNDDVRAAPRGSTTPAWLRAIVVRGLARDPEARWPSMDALLAALDDDPAIRRRRWWAAAIVVGLVGGASWAVMSMLGADAQTCTNMDAHLVGVWDDDRRAQVKAAIEATQLSYAADTAVRVEQQLDAYTKQWVAAREDACSATERGEQSGELLDLRMACLDERLTHVQAAVEVLAAANEEVVNKAVTLVAGLPRLDRCADIDALMAEQPPPEDPDAAKRVVELDEQLVEAETLRQVGRYDDGLALANAVESEAATLQYEPLQVRAWLRQGNLLIKTGELEGAATTLDRAYESALGLGMRTEAVGAASALVHLVGYQLGQTEQGRQWAKHARPLARLAGTDEAWASYLGAVSTLAIREGKFDEAREHLERALAMSSQALGPEHPQTVSLLVNLGMAANGEGKYSESRAYYERALAIREQSLGVGHPDTGGLLLNLGVAAQAEGKYEDARAYLERSLSILEQALGPDHAKVALAHSNLGVVATDLHALGDAREHFERAQAIFEATLGPEHVNVAMCLDNLGTVATKEGKHDEALALFQRALAIFEQALGPEHPDVATSLLNLGIAAKTQGKVDEARSHYARALAIFEQALGPEHPDVAMTLVNMGSLATSEGAWDRARSDYERALAIFEQALDAEHPSVAEARFALAGVLWEAPVEQGRDRARALKLAEQARLTYERAGNEAALAELRTWLAAHHE